MDQADAPQPDTADPASEQTAAPGQPSAPAEVAPPVVAAPAAAEPATVDHAQAAEELDLIKAVVMDSAELATRAASLATNAGTDMRGATELMVETHLKQRKQAIILLISIGALMLLAACVFIGISVSLSSRLKMVDGMLLAVGKRVTELNTTMETVASANEALHTMADHQEENRKLQEKLEAQLGEMAKSTQALPEAAAKQIEEKSQGLIKQVQSMDSRLQSQAASLQRLSQQVHALQGQVSDSGQKLRSEVESMTRQQRERLNAEQAAAKAAPKARDQALQYPRLPTPGASTPAASRP